MRKHLRYVWLLAVIAVTGWLFVCAHTLFTQGAPADSAALAEQFAGFSGTSSCSGRACHGGLGPAGAKDCEYTTFMLAPDPHTRAFAVLGQERSRVMVKNLRQLKTVDEAKPQTDALCLSCHGPATLAAGPKAGADDGFGCEACHGASQKWLGPHTARAAWAKLGPDKQRELGFKPMNTWADRARVCTECHVGSGERQVDHDLYAAGHPRLKFEFDTYEANLPRHWQPERDQDRGSAWAIGQVVAAQASLDLLAYRAETKNDRPWPEFAESDCYACHHDLKAKSWRQERGYSGIPGTLPFNEWYTFLPAVFVPEARDDIAALAKLMNRPLPDRPNAAQQAKACTDRLQAVLKTPDPLKGVVPSALFPKLIADDRALFPKAGDSVTVATWDIGAQMALALQSEYDRRDAKQRDPETAKALAELFRLLQFSKTGNFDSPVAFDGPAVVKQLEIVCNMMASGGR